MPAGRDRDRRRHPIGFGTALVLWVGVAALATWGFQQLLDYRQNPNRMPQARVADSGAMEVVLKRNAGGHFVTSGEINGREVTFLVDTGASDVSIPAAIADDLALERGPAVQYRTANGVVTGYLTRLDRVSVAGVSVDNVRGSVNPAAGFDDVLLGMSYLREIEFTQRGDELILRQYRP